MITPKTLGAALSVATLALGSSLPVLAGFHFTEQSFFELMEPGYYTVPGAVEVGNYAGPGVPGEFSFSVESDGGWLSIHNVASTGQYQVSGVGGEVAGAESATVYLSDGSSQTTSVVDGFLGFTTDLPLSLWVQRIEFFGDTTPSLSNFTIGVDVLLVPEPATCFAALLLGLPALAQGLSFWRRCQRQVS